MEKNHRLSRLNRAAKRELGREKASSVMKDAEIFFNGYLNEYRDDPEPVKRHTVKEIFPTVSFQRALEKNGLTRKDATDLISRAIWTETGRKAKWMAFGIRITGIWRKVPKMFISSLEHGFSREMGFDYRIHDTGRNRGKFDMLRCPYFSCFTELGYPELCDIYCTNDDIEDSRMHPKLIWARTKALGRGGDCCDFDIYYDEGKE